MAAFLVGTLMPCRYAMQYAGSGTRVNFGSKLCYTHSAQLSSLATWPYILYIPFCIPLFVYPPDFTAILIAITESQI